MKIKEIWNSIMILFLFIPDTRIQAMCLVWAFEPHSISRRMAAPRPSRIPSEVLSHPTQRIYLLSFFALAQAWKVSATKSFSIYVLTDVFLLAFFIPFFRIPLLQWTWRARIAAILVFVFLDLTLTSQWTLWDIFNSLPPVIWFRGKVSIRVFSDILCYLDW